LERIVGWVEGRQIAWSGAGKCYSETVSGSILNILASRKLIIVSFAALVICAGGGCSMKEEIKRIEAMKQAHEASQSARTSNLNGEQIYVRSCNTCHPSRRHSVGGSQEDLLDSLDKRFPEDAALKAFIRHGKGVMPAQPVTTLNDKELDNLVEYLRRLDEERKEKASEHE
jgi:mono/diheme cytochrome c family protein